MALLLGIVFCLANDFINDVYSLYQYLHDLCQAVKYIVNYCKNMLHMLLLLFLWT